MDNTGRSTQNILTVNLRQIRNMSVSYLFQTVELSRLQQNLGNWMIYQNRCVWNKFESRVFFVCPTLTTKVFIFCVAVSANLMDQSQMWSLTVPSIFPNPQLLLRSKCITRKLNNQIGKKWEGRFFRKN